MKDGANEAGGEEVDPVEGRAEPDAASGEEGAEPEAKTTVLSNVNLDASDNNFAST